MLGRVSKGITSIPNVVTPLSSFNIWKGSTQNTPKATNYYKPTFLKNSFLSPKLVAKVEEDKELTKPCFYNVS
jgi:hypothetical protein